MSQEKRWGAHPCMICPKPANRLDFVGDRAYFFCSKEHGKIFEVLATGLGGGLKKKGKAA